MPAEKPITPVVRMWEKIPAELKALRQWCWVTLKVQEQREADGSAKREKKPLNPNATGIVDARTDDASTWGTFEEACARAGTDGGVGFVITERDPYCCIDLDTHGATELRAEHTEILNTFDTWGAYVEQSTRGSGWHVWARRASALGPNIVRGPDRGCPIEIYDRAHFIICTGNTHTPKTALPELDWQLRALYEAHVVNEPTTSFREGNEVESDEDILARALAWDKTGIFAALHVDGDIRDYGNDASSADLAYWSRLIFAAKSGTSNSTPICFAQLARIYRTARIATHRQGAYPQKAARHAYVWRTYVRAMRDHCGHLDQSVDEFVAINAPTTQEAPAPIDVVEMSEPTAQDLEETAVVAQGAPPGLVGEIAQWVLESAYAPMRELSVMTALAFASGVMGRMFSTYNDSALHLHMVLVAPTATGKAHAMNAMSRLLKALKESHPEAKKFLGPTSYASGAALMRVISERQTMVSVIDEFGKVMSAAWNPRSDGDAWVKALLELYTANVSTGKAYAKEVNDLKEIDRQAFTLLGLTTESTLFERMTPSHLEDGEIPRLIISEVTKRGDFNEHQLRGVPDLLVGKVGRMVGAAIRGLQNNLDPTPIPLAVDVMARFKAFRKKCLHSYELGTPGDNLLSRAAENVVRVASLLAATDNPDCNPSSPMPCVKMHHWEWAENFVMSSVAGMIHRFENGDVGTGDAKQDADIERVVRNFTALPQARWKGYGITDPQHTARIIKRGFFTQTLTSKAFTEHPQGARAAIDKAIAGAVAAGRLRPLTSPEKTQRTIKGDAWFIL